MAHAPRSLALLPIFLLTAAAPGDDGRWQAGAYSFSDEMGGFHIRSVSGTGSRSDPIVVDEDFLSASPVTLVIRATQPVTPLGVVGDHANGFLHLRIAALNASGVGWVEFEFELQEASGYPSVYGDGLSFDQRRTEAGSISATGFAAYSRDFEPYDRLRFTQGRVDPGRQATFGFFVSDYTPRPMFYLVQDPRIPFS